MVNEGGFRADLYFRLNVFPVTVPPLRERRGDIPSLIRHFSNQFTSRIGKEVKSVTRISSDLLSRYSWPGNVRELRNFIERSLILGEETVMKQDDTFFKTIQDYGISGSAGTLAEFERSYILTILDRTGWVIKGPGGAARQLGMKPSTLYSRMKKLGISRKSARSIFRFGDEISSSGPPAPNRNS
jgi:transcriptional regulator with GAF, ATPase, and Fis domain